MDVNELGIAREQPFERDVVDYGRARGGSGRVLLRPLPLRRRCRDGCAPGTSSPNWVAQRPLARPARHHLGPSREWLFPLFPSRWLLPEVPVRSRLPPYPPWPACSLSPPSVSLLWNGRDG